jgi:hypothetical protein
MSKHLNGKSLEDSNPQDAKDPKAAKAPSQEN